MMSPSSLSPMVMSVLLLAVVGGVAGYSGKVLLVSMDGFRWDYINKVSGLSNFSRLADTGCSVDYVNNVFVTKTSPCHYTIVTGDRHLYFLRLLRLFSLFLLLPELLFLPLLYLLLLLCSS